MIKNNRLITPKSTVILPGITRGFLIRNAEIFGLDACEQEIEVDDIGSFDEIFLTNSLRSIILVNSVNGFDNLKSKQKAEQIQKTYFEMLSNN